MNWGLFYLSTKLKSEDISSQSNSFCVVQLYTYVFVVLGMGPRVLCMLGKLSTTISWSSTIFLIWTKRKHRSSNFCFQENNSTYDCLFIQREVHRDELRSPREMSSLLPSNFIFFIAKTTKIICSRKN